MTGRGAIARSVPGDAAPAWVLEALARSHGVETEYVDAGGRQRVASREALVAVLAALGAPVDRAGDLEDALRERQQAADRRLVEPIVVSWEGEATIVPLALGWLQRFRGVECRLAIETGGSHEWSTREPEIALPPDLRAGYHDLELSVGGDRVTTRVIRAPSTAHDPDRRGWGAFLPLHALRTLRSAGTGDLSDLGALLAWTRGLGGAVVATLPLLAQFLDEPFEATPYRPASRLFWNEAYVDPAAAPGSAGGWTGPAGGPRAPSAADLAAEAAALRRAALVDWRAAAAHRRRALEPLAETFFAAGGERSEPFRRFLAENPEASAYARFRSAVERSGPWPGWSNRAKAGDLGPGDYDEAAVRYHLYAQWLADLQLAGLAGGGAAGLYLDVPLGVHPDGFDPWRWPRLFARGASAGAPPDAFFAGGQEWGVPPLHPDRLREDGYRYPAAVLRAHCRKADVVRIDHVMAFHRLFWVPDGVDPTEGVYVRYRPDEWWAVACLESSRHRSAIVGEDLGTVPPETREAIEAHAARRSWVLPFELADDPPRLSPIPARSVASLDTHDTPTFAGWWRGLDDVGRRTLAEALGQAGARGAGLPAEGTEPGWSDDLPESQRPRPFLEAALRRLAESDARLVLVNLEDLWLEEERQNVPGTSIDERPNWRRKARFSFELFSAMPEVVATLRDVDARRRESA